MAGGENNAFTNADITNFYDVLPAENIEVGLWLEANRMERLKLTKNTRYPKKVVIENSKRPVSMNPMAMYAPSFGSFLSDAPLQVANHWCRHQPHQAIQLEDTHSFYSRNYGPHNAILVLSGNVKTSRF